MSTTRIVLPRPEETDAVARAAARTSARAAYDRALLLLVRRVLRVHAKMAERDVDASAEGLALASLLIVFCADPTRAFHDLRNVLTMNGRWIAEEGALLNAAQSLIELR